MDVRIGALDQPQERPNQPRLGGGFGRPRRFGQDRTQQVKGLALKLGVLGGERVTECSVTVTELEGGEARPVVADEGCIMEGTFSGESARLWLRESCGVERDGKAAHVSH